jgi:hypothetical protein
MKRGRAAADDKFPFALLGKNKKKAARELAAVDDVKLLHANLLAFVATRFPVSLGVQQAGPYLSWPEITPESRVRIRELMPRGKTLDADYELAGSCGSC